MYECLANLCFSYCAKNYQINVFNFTFLVSIIEIKLHSGKELATASVIVYTVIYDVYSDLPETRICSYNSSLQSLMTKVFYVD